MEKELVFLNSHWLSFLPSQVLLSCCIETIIFSVQAVTTVPLQSDHRAACHGVAPTSRKSCAWSVGRRPRDDSLF